MDKDGSGQIDSSEFYDCVKHLLQDHTITQADCSRFFEFLDPGGDGTLSYKELDKIMIATRARAEKMKKHQGLLFNRTKHGTEDPITVRARELFMAMAKCMRDNNIALKELISTHDLDKSDGFTEDELEKSAIGLGVAADKIPGKAELTQIFMIVDTNYDGDLSYDELDAVLKVAKKEVIRLEKEEAKKTREEKKKRDEMRSLELS